MKLLALLDDPETRALVFALAHSGHPAGPARLRALAMTGAGLSDEVVSSVAAYLGSDPAEVTRQLTRLLPDLLHALRPGGVLMSTTELTEQLQTDVMLDEDSAGAFGR